MNIPFNMGDPVRCVRTGRVGKVIGLIEPTYDAMGIPMRMAQIVVQPPMRRYTSVVYYEEELEICRCVNRGVRTQRRAEPCVKSAPF